MHNVAYNAMSTKYILMQIITAFFLKHFGSTLVMYIVEGHKMTLKGHLRLLRMYINNSYYQVFQMFHGSRHQFPPWLTVAHRHLLRYQAYLAGPICKRRESFLYAWQCG